MRAWLLPCLAWRPAAATGYPTERPPLGPGFYQSMQNANSLTFHQDRAIDQPFFGLQYT